MSQSSDVHCCNQRMQQALEPCKSILYRQKPVHSFSSRAQDAADQLVDALEGSIRLPTYGIGNEAYSSLVAQTKLIIASPLLIFPPFHHTAVSLETTLEDLVFALICSGFSISNVTEPIREDLKLLLIHSAYISGGKYRSISKIFFFWQKPSDSIHYKLETGIQLHQYPRRVFTCTQSSRPSETVVGESDGLHLLE